MTVVDVRDAQTHLSDLISRAQRGEDIVVTRSGEPAVRLLPVPAEERTFGIMPISIPDRLFFGPLGEVELAPWEASGDTRR
jgi:prevent-host-death family protein